jgi:flagellar basal-body rod protein FlgC
MNISGGVTLSALRAFGTKMGVAGHNIANMETEGFKKSRAVLKEGQTGVVETEIEKIETEGPRAFTVGKNGEAVETELSNVDLTEEIPQMQVAQRSHEANTKVLITQEEMIGTVIDMLG